MLGAYATLNYTSMLAQFVCVICGFFFLAMRMRGYGYPGEPIVFQISSFGFITGVT